MADPEIDIDAIVAETIEFVTVRPEGDGWVGDAPDWFGERLFGGFVLSQSVHAVTRTAPGRAHIRDATTRGGAGRRTGVHDDVLVHSRHRRLRVRAPDRP